MLVSPSLLTQFVTSFSDQLCAGNRSDVLLVLKTSFVGQNLSLLM